jgi:hypothetical protein
MRLKKKKRLQIGICCSYEGTLFELSIYSKIVYFCYFMFTIRCRRQGTQTISQLLGQFVCNNSYPCVKCTTGAHRDLISDYFIIIIICTVLLLVTCCG